MKNLLKISMVMALLCAIFIFSCRKDETAAVTATPQASSVESTTKEVLNVPDETTQVASSVTTAKTTKKITTTTKKAIPQEVETTTAENPTTLTSTENEAAKNGIDKKVQDNTPTTQAVVTSSKAGPCTVKVYVNATAGEYGATVLLDGLSTAPTIQPIPLTSSSQPVQFVSKPREFAALASKSATSVSILNNPPAQGGTPIYPWIWEFNLGTGNPSPQPVVVTIKVVLEPLVGAGGATWIYTMSSATSNPSTTTCYTPATSTNPAYTYPCMSNVFQPRTRLVETLSCTFID